MVVNELYGPPQLDCANLGHKQGKAEHSGKTMQTFFYSLKRVHNKLDTFPLRQSACLSVRLSINQSVSQSRELCQERDINI